MVDYWTGIFAASAITLAAAIIILPAIAEVLR